LRIIFLKKKHIYYGIIVLILLILAAILLNIPKDSIATFSAAVDNQMKRIDLTGDGIEDIVYVKTEDNKYSVEISTNNKNLFLVPDKKLNSLGTYTPYSPLRLTFMDISRDKTPEIFTQAQENNTSVQHAFMYNNGKFCDLMCNTNAILGFVDSNSNKTPKVLSGNINNNNIQLDNYILINNKLEKFTYNFNSSFMGKDSVLSFIRYVESLPYDQNSIPAEAFYSQISGNDLASFGKLSADNCTYKFQNALFMDSKWNKNGDVTEIKWSISFKGTSNIDAKQIKNRALNLILIPNKEPLNQYYYKISSISLE
ncbi:MAG: VCBS repeat-containing protein, partial [Bacillota bacterium]|nr:VCBS repeat-containing protein [Bacillota bacterium]